MAFRAGIGFKRKNALPSIGDRFGELTVVGLTLGTAGGLCRVIVKCDCGGPEHHALLGNLLAGRKTRCRKCGCRVAGAFKKKYHGYDDVVADESHRRRLLGRISACLNRCGNPKDAGYPNYGGRGIAVFEPWRTSRRDFLAYLVTLDGWDQPQLELDREDVDGNYEPGNLRFITHRANQGNRRKTQNLQRRITELQAEVGRLRSDVRHSERGAETPLHDIFA